MKYQNKSALLLSLFAVAPVTFAGPPVAFDEWSVIGGTIDTSLSCGGASVTCDDMVSDQGMLYQQVTTDAGTFLRLIITETDATYDPTAAAGQQGELTFADESFIPFALEGDTAPPASGGFNSLALPQGLVSKQTIRDSADNFEATTHIQRANMRQYTSDWQNPVTTDEMFSIKIDQSFATDEMTSDFSHTAYTQFMDDFNNAADPDTDIVIGSKTDIDQSLDMTDANNPVAKQLFVQRSREGYKGTSVPKNYNSGGYFIGEALTTASELNISGTAVTWDATDRVTTTWVAQDASAAVLPVSYQSVNVNNDAKQDSALIFEQPTGPIDWDANFGAEPTF